MNHFDIGAVLFRHRRAIVALLLAFAVGGVMAWRSMPKEEDPTFAARFGSIVVSYPGADPETIEDLVIIPIEEEVRTVDGVATVNASASAGVGFVLIELDGAITEPDPYWNKVETALERAQREFPPGTGAPETNWDSFDLEGVLYAVSGSGDMLTLWEGAEILAEELRSVPGVKAVEITPEIDRRVTVSIDEGTLAALGLTRGEIADRLSAGLQTVPGGVISTADQSAIVDPESSIFSVEALRAYPLTVATGATLPLESVGRAQLQPTRPRTAVARYNGSPAVLVGVVPQQNLDGIAFGERTTKAAAHADERLRQLGLTAELASYQPGWIASRLEELLGSLLLGVAIVAAVVVLSMGVRLGLTVAVMVPIVTLAGVFVYAAGGGILHQISIAALVMALGLLVDNAIVVSERIQWYLDHGEDRIAAAGRAVRELFVPLAAATGTTLAAYLPLLLARGETSEFTAAIPRVAMLMLSLSFAFAVIATPTIAMLTLRRSKNKDAQHGGDGDGNRLTNAIANLSIKRPRLVLALTLLIVPVTVGLIGRVELTFFPDADRNQMVIDLELPQDRNIHATEDAVRRIERRLLEEETVLSVVATAGRTVPRFYYNVLSRTNAPHLGQLLVETRAETDIAPLSAILRDWAPRALPGATVVASRLAQGPPVSAPIEVRVSAEDQDQLAHEVDLIKGLLRDISGTLDVRSTLAPAAPSYRLAIDDGAVARLGLSRGEIAREVLAVTRGIESGTLNVGHETVPVVVTSTTGEHTADSRLAQTLVRSRATGDLVPLSSVAVLELTTTPVGIVRRNGERTAAVLSGLTPGVGYNSVLAELRRRLPVPEPGVTVAIGGSAEESADANSAIAEQAMIGGAVLLGILLLQFASFRRVMIILITVPLAAVGVIPGLVIFGQPFGFTSMLGVIALIGIVVNNAIILVDLMDSRMREGQPQAEAIRSAVRERIRPIVLTAGTTVAGMVPLLLTSSSLWPPFASAVISGLTVSTILTLVVVPATYRLMIIAPRDGHVLLGSRAAAAVLLVGTFLFAPVALDAQQSPAAMTIVEIAAAARTGAPVTAAEREAAAVELHATADRRAAFLPSLGVEAEVLRRNQELSFDFGPVDSMGTTISVTEAPDWEGQLAAVMTQPLFNMEEQIGRTDRGRWEIREAAAQREEIERSHVLSALETALEGARVSSEIRSAQASREALAASVGRLDRLATGGRATETELALLEIELARLDEEIAYLRALHRIRARNLGRAVGAPGSVVLELGSLPARSQLSSLAEGDAETRSDHPTLRQLTASAGALRARERELRLSALPTIELQLRAIQPVNNSLDQDRWFEGAVLGRWVPMAAGERRARRRAIQETRRGLSERLADTALALEHGAVTYRDQVQIALRRLAVEERAVAVYQQRRAEVERLLQAGRATTTELIDVDAELRAARSSVTGAWIDATLAYLRYRSVTGSPFV